MGEPVIETHNLGKRYGSAVAVDSLDLSVQKGEVFGLLGPNGSGKTTTILMLLGLTEPTAGSVRVLGLDPARRPLSVKARVGYMPDEVGFYDELSARSNLAYIARLNGLARDVAGRRIANALERVGLTATADQPVSTFSRGMRQRLGVADVLLKEPQLIIMDEPTQGLDPEGAHAFLRTVHDLQEEGITFLLSSHLLYQVQVVCDRVGLFRQGRMELEGTVADLAQRVLGSGYHILLQAEGVLPELQAALERVPGTVDVQPNGDGCYRVAANRDARPEVAEAVVSAGGRLLSLGMEAPSLDDIYSRYFEEVENVGRN
jgi:ABC-2 type transport system ATP-binding protein